MSYQITVGNNAKRFLRKLDNADQLRVLAGLKGLPLIGDIIKMKGYVELYRLRIGTYRAIFSIDHNEKVVYVQAIENRGDIY